MLPSLLQQYLFTPSYNFVTVYVRSLISQEGYKTRIHHISFVAILPDSLLDFHEQLMEVTLFVVQLHQVRKPHLPKSRLNR